MCMCTVCVASASACDYVFVGVREHRSDVYMYLHASIYGYACATLYTRRRASVQRYKIRRTQLITWRNFLLTTAS